MFNKRNTDAYTLIELMAAVLILGIVATITIVSTNYIIKSSKRKLYKEQINRIEESVKNWSINNTNSLPNTIGGIVFFEIEELLNKEVIDTETVLDPRNNGELNGCITIKFDEANNQFDYEYIELGCKELADTYKPIITVSGSTNQYVEVNDINYQIPSSTAVSYSGEPLTVTGPIIRTNGNIVENIDLGIVGTIYTLTYVATDLNSGLVKEKNITLTVRDTTMPVLMVNGDAVSHTIIHQAGPDFNEPDVIVKDNSCGLDGMSINVNNCSSTLTPTSTGSVAPQLPGTYNLTYRAMDSSSNVKFFVVTVVVDDTIAPTAPTYVTKLGTSSGAIYDGSTNWTNENVWAGNLSSIDDGTGVKSYEFAFDCIGAYTPLTPDGTNNYTVSVPFGSAYNGNICFRAVDNKLTPNVGNSTSVPIKLDKAAPQVSFSSNGTVNYVKSVNTIVTVTDVHSGLVTAKPKYQWTITPTSPTDESFVQEFTSGDSIISPAGASGLYYLWIYASDRAGNVSKISSSIYKLDNLIPVITLSGVNPYEMIVGDTFVEPGKNVVDNSGVISSFTTSTIPTTSGTHTITYTAIDEAGNVATLTRNLYIWSLWSDWSNTISTSTPTKKVELKIQYRYRDLVLTGTTYKSCQNVACGQDCTTNSCPTAACGVNLYNSCQSSDCGQSCTTKTCSNSCCGTCTKWCEEDDIFSCRSYPGGTYTVCGSYPTCTTVPCCGQTCVNKTCRTAACGVESYKTCVHSDCGQTCVNRTCRTSACGIESQTFDWNAWSIWQDTLVTPSATREVETQTVYRFRTR